MSRIDLHCYTPWTNFLLIRHNFKSTHLFLPRPVFSIPEPWRWDHLGFCLFSFYPATEFVEAEEVNVGYPLSCWPYFRFIFFLARVFCWERVWVIIFPHLYEVVVLFCPSLLCEFGITSHASSFLAGLLSSLLFLFVCFAFSCRWKAAIPLNHWGGQGHCLFDGVLLLFIRFLFHEYLLSPHQHQVQFWALQTQGCLRHKCFTYAPASDPASLHSRAVATFLKDSQ